MLWRTRIEAQWRTPRAEGAMTGAGQSGRLAGSATGIEQYPDLGRRPS